MRTLMILALLLPATAVARPTIFSSTNTEVCSDLLAGPFPEVLGTRLRDPIRVDPTRFPRGFSGEISRVAEVDISQPSHPDRLGYISGVWSDSGCPVEGVTVMIGGTSDTESRNRYLLQYQYDLLGCQNAKAFVARDRGREYVEIDTGSGTIRSTMHPVRTLVLLTEGGVLPVCRIVDRP